MIKEVLPHYILQVTVDLVGRNERVGILGVKYISQINILLFWVFVVM